jgi:hypothetical protein
VTYFPPSGLYQIDEQTHSFQGQLGDKLNPHWVAGATPPLWSCNLRFTRATLVARSFGLASALNKGASNN